MNKKIKGLILLVVLAILGAIVMVIAGPASAHDAPPQGSASCTNNTTWEVINGHATTENTGGLPVVVTISSSAGTVTQSNGSVTGDGKTITFSVSDIPLSTNSIQIDSKTTWAGGGVDHHYSTIGKPSSGCTTTVAIPAAPLSNPPTCSAPGSVVIPVNSGILKWTAGPGTNDVTVHIAGGTNVTFTDGKTAESFTETVLPQLSGTVCTARITPPTLTVNPASCTSAGTLVIPANTDKVKWLVNGSQINNGTGGTLGAGTYSISAHTTFSYLFTGDVSSVLFTKVVPGSLIASDQCAPVDKVIVTTDDFTGPAPTCAVPSVTWTAQITRETIHYTFDKDSQTWIAAPPFYVHLAPLTKTVTLDKSVVCTTPVVPVALVTNKPLANTGSDTALLIGVGGGLLLLGSLFLGLTMAWGRRS